MRSGLDIARLWMDGEAAIFNVQGREDNGHIAIMQVGSPSPVPSACGPAPAAMPCSCMLALHVSRQTQLPQSALVYRRLCVNQTFMCALKHVSFLG